MRSRIKAEMSNFYKNDIMLPGILAEYQVGFYEMIMLNKAYALMLFDEKIINKNETSTILSGLTRVQNELKIEDLDGKYEELYYNVEHALFERVTPEIGGKLHTGRSRNDIYATLWRMEVRRSLWEICDMIIQFREELAAKAKENIDTVITGYTHTQPAQPITLGHYYLAVTDSLGRDLKRLQNSYQMTNLCPFGAAALAGTIFPIDRQTLKELLGFDDLLRNTLDAVQTRDYQLEALSAFSIMATTLSRVAQDHYIWATDEFNIFEIGGEVAISSSIMPQKKNPCALESTKAKAAHSIGAIASALSAVKNIPFSLCLDLFEVSEPYWNAYKNVQQSLRLLKESLKYSSFNKERALERAKNNFSTVTAIADHLVKVFGISFVAAHSIVGKMVADVYESGELMGGMNSSLLRDVSKMVIGKSLELNDDEIASVLDPIENVKSKDTYGGPSQSSMEIMLNETKIELENDKNWLAEAKEKVHKAYTEISDRESNLN
jgi:argininosuccinate lyase